MYAPRSIAFTGLSLLSMLSTPTTAQSSDDSQSTTMTVYAMVDNRRPTPSSASITITWTGSVISATPSATTYSLAIPPLTGGFYTQTDITLVNGPSTYAAWQVYNGSSTFGEFCTVLDSPATAAEGDVYPRYDCDVTYLGARGNGDISTTFLETATNTYGMENRTFLGVPAVITEGVEALGNVASAPPGEYTAAATATSATGEEGDEGVAAETGTSAEGTAATSTGEGGAVATLTEEGAAVGRGYAFSAPLLVLGPLVALLV